MTLPELSAELLPCPNPWCNDSKPTIVSRKGESREYHNVFCDTCDIGPSPSFHSRSEAIAAWNTRTNQLVERDAVAGMLTDDERSLWVRTVLTIIASEPQRRAFSDGYNGYSRPPNCSDEMRRKYALGRAVHAILNPKPEAPHAD